MAFANTAGGNLLVGVEDGSRRVCATSDVLKMEERLANLIADSIHPQLVPEIEVMNWRNLNVIAVRVYPSNTRPLHLASMGADSGTFIRVGSTNRRAGVAQIEELKRLNRMDSFDEQALPSCSRLIKGSRIRLGKHFVSPRNIRVAKSRRSVDSFYSA